MKKGISKVVATFLILWFPVCTVLASDDWSDFDEDLPPVYDETETEEETTSEDDTSYDTESDSYEYGTDSDYSSYESDESETATTESSYGTESYSEESYDTETAPVSSEEETEYTETDPSYGEESFYGSESETTSSDSEDSSYGTETAVTEESSTDDASYSDDTEDSAFDFVEIKKHERHAESQFQNAIIEGVQVTTEEGASSDEKVVTCYFIFRDLPSNYFYDVDHKNKELVFEFNDTRTGNSPVTTVREDPITGFEIEEMQVDANRDIKGLKPEWHDQIRVTFDLKKIPVFTVSDEHDIISFKYKWTTNPEKVDMYVQKGKFPTVFLWSGVGLGSLGVGLLSYFLLKEPPKPKIDPTLKDNDLPRREVEQ
ncbi:MAG: hypothetical protein ACLFQB_00500 [Chitinispirillaceae bacterium]